MLFAGPGRPAPSCIYLPYAPSRISQVTVAVAHARIHVSSLFPNCVCLHLLCECTLCECTLCVLLRGHSIAALTLYAGKAVVCMHACMHAYIHVCDGGAGVWCMLLCVCVAPSSTSAHECMGPCMLACIYGAMHICACVARTRTSRGMHARHVCRLYIYVEGGYLKHMCMHLPLCALTSICI